MEIKTGFLLESALVIFWERFVDLEASGTPAIIGDRLFTLFFPVSMGKGRGWFF